MNDWVSAARELICAQRHALDVLLDIDADSLNRAFSLLYSCTGKIVVMGVGKSGHVGKKIAATLASTGSPAFFIHPTEALHGDLGMISADDVLLCLSKSGQADEFRQILPIIKNPVVAITQGGGFLHAHATVGLLLGDFDEGCPLGIAPMASTTATMALGDALAVMLMRAKGVGADDFARHHPAGRLGKRLLWRVRDLMNDAPMVDVNANLREALLVMSDGKLGMTAVMDNGALVGMITDGDVRRHWLNGGQDLRAMMTHDPKCIDADELANNAYQMMMDLSISQLLVLKNDALVGVISLRDLVKAGL